VCKTKGIIECVVLLNSFRDRDFISFVLKLFWPWLSRSTCGTTCEPEPFMAHLSLFNNSPPFLMKDNYAGNLKFHKIIQVAKALSWSTMSTNGPNPVRYICYVCQGPRSSTFHSRYPPGEPPPSQGVCRRCVREESCQPPPTTIFEIHHYHHDCACKHDQPRASTMAKLPPPPPYLGCAELPAEDLRYRKGSPLVPPPVGPKPRI
jgi:hypothetical protein